jgi:dynein heavy chain
MVYVQPSLLGWKSIYKSWLNTLPVEFNSEHRARLTVMVDWLMPPMLRTATRMCKMMQPMQEENLAESCFRLIECLIDEFKDPKKLEEMTGGHENILTVWLDSIFLFSLVWTVGGDVDEEGRKKFDSVLRKLLVGEVHPELKPYMKGKEQKVTQLFPDGRQVGNGVTSYWPQRREYSQGLTSCWSQVWYTVT